MKKPYWLFIFFLFISGISFAEKATPSKKLTPPPAPKMIPKIVPRIVIDPGHGGKDPGALSKYHIREKALVLSISKKIAHSLNKRGAKAVLTRAGDRFITLEARDRIANKNQCDLFLSIHANSSPNKSANGIEIYYLNKATDRAAQKLASRENRGAPKTEREIGAILSDLLQTASTEESADLANKLDRSMRRSLQEKYGMESIHVKTALFYVLVGAKCPSLLIEVGFITNPREAKRLKNIHFQKDLADVIAETVMKYLASEKARSDL